MRWNFLYNQLLKSTFFSITVAFSTFDAASSQRSGMHLKTYTSPMLTSSMFFSQKTNFIVHVSLTFLEIWGSHNLPQPSLLTLKISLSVMFITSISVLTLVALLLRSLCWKSFANVFGEDTPVMSLMKIVFPSFELLQFHWCLRLHSVNKQTVLGMGKTNRRLHITFRL